MFSADEVKVSRCFQLLREVHDTISPGNYSERIHAGTFDGQSGPITTLSRLLLIQVVEEEALELKLLKTCKDYRLAFERLNDLSRAKPNTPESNEAEVLSLLLKEYEQRNPVTARKILSAVKARSACRNDYQDCVYPV